MRTLPRSSPAEGVAQMSGWLIDTFVWTGLLIGLVLAARRPVSQYFGAADRLCAVGAAAAALPACRRWCCPPAWRRRCRCSRRRTDADLCRSPAHRCRPREHAAKAAAAIARNGRSRWSICCCRYGWAGRRSSSPGAFADICGCAGTCWPRRARWARRARCGWWRRRRRRSGGLRHQRQGGGAAAAVHGANTI